MEDMAEFSSPYVHQTDSSSGCSFSLLFNCKMSCFLVYVTWTKELKDTNPLMSSLLVFCLGWYSNFVGSESGQKQSLKHSRIWSTAQFNIPPPRHTHCLYILYILYTYFGKGGGGQREGTLEGQQYTSIAPSSMGVTVHNLG
jgi:hypothetical protein